jgi:hypothetical protein
MQSVAFHSPAGKAARNADLKRRQSLPVFGVILLRLQAITTDALEQWRSQRGFILLLVSAAS